MNGRALCILGLSVLCASEARADDARDLEARLRLVYVAPKECEPAERVRERVVSLVRTPPATWKNAVEVRVTIERTPRSYVGRVAVVEIGATEQHPAERELRAVSCLSVVDALAVSAALAVDDALEEAASAESQISPEPEFRASAPPAVLQPPKRPPGPLHSPVRRRPLDLRIGSEVGLRDGLVPAPLWVQTAWFSVGRRSWPTFRGELGFGASRIARTEEGAYRARLFEAGVLACSPADEGWLSYLSLCAGVSGGALVTSSFEVIRSAHRSRPWFAAFLAPRASIPITAGLSIVAEGRLAMPFFRERLRFYPGTTVYEAPVVLFQGAIGVEVTVPTGPR